MLFGIKQLGEFVVIYRDGEDGKRSRFWGKYLEFYFGSVKFKMLFRFLSRGVELDLKIWSFKEEARI